MRLITSITIANEVGSTIKSKLSFVICWLWARPLANHDH